MDRLNSLLEDIRQASGLEELTGPPSQERHTYGRSTSSAPRTGKKRAMGIMVRVAFKGDEWNVYQVTVGGSKHKRHAKGEVLLGKVKRAGPDNTTRAGWEAFYRDIAKPFVKRYNSPYWGDVVLEDVELTEAKQFPYEVIGNTLGLYPDGKIASYESSPAGMSFGGDRKQVQAKFRKAWLAYFNSHKGEMDPASVKTPVEAMAARILMHWGELEMGRQDSKRLNHLVRDEVARQGGLAKGQNKRQLEKARRKGRMEDVELTEGIMDKEQKADKESHAAFMTELDKRLKKFGRTFRGTVGGNIPTISVDDVGDFGAVKKKIGRWLMSMDYKLTEHKVAPKGSWSIRSRDTWKQGGNNGPYVSLSHNEPHKSLTVAVDTRNKMRPRKEKAKAEPKKKPAHTFGRTGQGALFSMEALQAIREAAGLPPLETMDEGKAELGAITAIAKKIEAHLRSKKIRVTGVRKNATRGGPDVLIDVEHGLEMDPRATGYDPKGVERLVKGAMKALGSHKPHRETSGKTAEGHEWLYSMGAGKADIGVEMTHDDQYLDFHVFGM